VRKKLTVEEMKKDLLALMIELRSQFVVGYSADKSGHTVRKLSAKVADGPAGEKREVVVKDEVVIIK
jgi:hypothetical protein